MRFRFAIICIYAITTILTGCKREEHPFQGLQALEGSWMGKMGDSEVMETWKKEGDSLLQGFGYEISGTDTTLFEKLSLVRRGDEVYYIATVPGQNNEQPVSFKMTGSLDQEFIFENPGHDFPDKISYRFLDNDRFMATVTGNIEGKAQKIELDFKRLQPGK